ncbi:MAG: tryptophan--tRNA ligase [Alphaproteobacteria bacterium]|nr:tryptophan--tRNA ligase [Alphaproteobacteria bacterium]
MNGRIFSGVQPTGNLHLGNYLGAIRNWVEMQKNYDCIFCIVDLHAITVPQDPEALRNATREVTAAYIACGIDPQNAVIFNQSAVSAHAELAWILNCFTPLGWLNRMTQFKEKAGKHRDNALLGLYSYPVLMAADILAYKATHVPVGEDQKQHLELARDIAGAFNRRYEKEFFPIPEPVIAGHATRVMSLQDGTKKMSKSDPSEKSRIALTDDADTISKKIRKAKSDMIEGLSWDPENRPEAVNLINIFSTLSGESREEITARYASSGFAPFKKDLADVAVAHLAPITAKMRELLADPAYIDQVLRQGAENANATSQQVLAEVKETVGFLIS